MKSFTCLTRYFLFASSYLFLINGNATVAVINATTPDPNNSSYPLVYAQLWSNPYYMFIECSSATLSPFQMSYLSTKALGCGSGNDGIRIKIEYRPGTPAICGLIAVPHNGSVRVTGDLLPGYFCNTYDSSGNLIASEKAAFR